MRYNLKNLLAASILSGLCGTTAAAQLSVPEAINIAGKQRMVTQRLLKDYAMVGMNMTQGNPAADLKAMIELFDDDLMRLKTLNTEGEIAKSLAHTEALWSPIKTVLSGSPDAKKVVRLQKDLDRLLAACHENTQLLTQASGRKSGEIINLSGRQRMLSQRMAALYMLKAWKIEDPEFLAKLNQSMTEFSEAHGKLESSPLTTAEIKAHLKQVKKAYAWFEMMGRSKSNHVIPSLINKSANTILSEMDAVTVLYTKTKH